LGINELSLTRQIGLIPALLRGSAFIDALQNEWYGKAVSKAVTSNSAAFSQKS
jgi:hypothetical protein